MNVPILLPATKADRKLFSRIRAALRRVWMWYSENRKQVFEANRVDKKNWRCESCKGLFKRKEMKADHIVPCGRLREWEDLPGFCYRLFLGKLQLLCETCHDAKTKAEKKSRAY